MDIDGFALALVRGERVSRHEFDIPAHVIREMEEMQWLDRDVDGYVVRGELFDIHLGNFDE